MTSPPSLTLRFHPRVSALEMGLGGRGVHLVQPTHPAEIPEEHALLSMMEVPFPEKRYASDSGNLIRHVKHCHL